MTNLPLHSPADPEPSEAVRRDVQQAIDSNRVVLFMKGTPELPACGFSRRASEIISGYGVDFAWVNVLEDPRIRQELTSISKWPTIPQLFVSGELIGGSDILGQLDESGELAAILADSR